MMTETGFEEFTEIGYEQLLRAALTRWQTVTFPEYATAAGAVCLWRHDVDMSPHRALRLAAIEQAHGARATYFIHLHSEFYNVFEVEVVRRLAAICDLGHLIGLHFDPLFYISIDERRMELIDALQFERDILERLLQVRVGAFSIHNPDVGGAADALRHLDESQGMINAYGPAITHRFTYLSDSNGYWRHRSFQQLITAEDADRVHVLTHPEWWTPEPMSPRARVQRCVDGRCRRQLERYDALLAGAGRRNIR
jgi:hypothetical protein